MLTCWGETMVRGRPFGAVGDSRPADTAYREAAVAETAHTVARLLGQNADAGNLQVSSQHKHLGSWQAI